MSSIVGCIRGNMHSFNNKAMQIQEFHIYTILFISHMTPVDAFDIDMTLLLRHCTVISLYQSRAWIDSLAQVEWTGPFSTD